LVVDANLHQADVVAHDEEDVGLLLALLLLGRRLLGLLLRPLLLLCSSGTASDPRRQTARANSRKK